MSGAFRVEWPKPGLAHLVMDDPARKVNVLDERALADLEIALAVLEAEPALSGVVLRSGKRSGFIAGADIDAIGALTDREAVLRLIRRAHVTFLRLGALQAPSVAAIDGVCLGGGTELALACDSRVAAEETAQIGLPETLLGIFPGFGGTTRLPRLVGIPTALDLILTARNVDARRAEKMGLVARSVPQAWLIERAEAHLAEIAKRPPARRRDAYRPRGFMAWALEGNSLGRSLVFQRAQAMTKARTQGHYPAPPAAIRVMQLVQGKPLPEALELEARWASDLVVSPVCKNLVRIFQSQERAKKDPPGIDAALKPAAVERLAVVGAGVMGGGIAELASRNGIQVRLRDVQPASLTRAMQTVHERVAERSRKRRVPRAERDAQLARILPTLDLSGFKRVDFAIEAVVEDLDIKRRVLAELEVRIGAGAVLATNTSSLSVSALAEGLEHPERFCGFHFFNPVHRMPLVEIVRGRQTSPGTVLTAVALARRLGKTPVVVADSPGFVVNRILMPYLREAMHLLEDGYPLVEIDASMKAFGMPMGPFEVLDEVGLDVAAKVAAVLTRAFPDRMSAAPAIEKLLAAGRLGRKSGLGFYRHRGRQRTADPALRALLGRTRVRRAQSPELLSERMVLAMINEGARCLEESVVPDAGMLDVAMIFGAGFPPFRGGLMRHADALGLSKIEARLNALRAEKGERFSPAKRLVKLAAEGGAFTGPGR